MQVSFGNRVTPRASRPRGGGLGGRLIIAVIMAVIALVGYFGSQEFNPVTEETQHISLTKEQEITMGLQAAPEMAQEYGGLDPDQQAQATVDEIGQDLVANSVAADTGYPFEFHLLDDPETVNAFALPGGQVFITQGLYDRLETRGQLAGVLAHEIGHVVARHSAEQIAQQQLTQGLTGALVIATYDPEHPTSQQAAQMAALVGQLINMKFSREDELQADTLGVRLMVETGYDPRALIRVMEILAEASGGQQQPEFTSTHPNPDNRIQEIQAAIDEYYPNGVPDGLIR